MMTSSNGNIFGVTGPLCGDPLVTGEWPGALIYYWSAHKHYNDVIMSSIASQITSLTIVYSTVYSRTDPRKHQSSASLAFVWGIHRWLVNFPHKAPVTRKMFPFDNIMTNASANSRDAGSLRRRRAHYDVTLMLTLDITSWWWRPFWTSK